jgi:hypothetical protein
MRAGPSVGPGAGRGGGRDSGADGVGRPRPSGRMALTVIAALVISGCGQVGSATTRIDDGEDELEGLVAEIVEAVSLEVTTQRPFGNRSSCVLVNNDPGASNSLSLGGPLPEIDDVLGRATAVLASAGYEIIQGDRASEVFGRRDGLRITVVEDGPTGQLAIDAATGCRALPR